MVIQNRVSRVEAEKSKPFARTIDDKDLNVSAPLQNMLFMSPIASLITMLNHDTPLPRSCIQVGASAGCQPYRRLSTLHLLRCCAVLTQSDPND